MDSCFLKTIRIIKYTSEPFKSFIVSFSEKTLIFVGEKRSGKTSLISKFLDEPIKDDMKSTTALEFKCGTRTKDDKKQKVNFYELGNFLKS